MGDKYHVTCILCHSPNYLDIQDPPPPSYQAYLPPGARKTGDLPINSIAAALRDTANLNHQNIRTKSSFYTTIPWRYWNYACSNIKASKSMVSCKLHPNWTFPYWPNAPFQFMEIYISYITIERGYTVCPFGKCPSKNFPFSGKLRPKPNSSERWLGNWPFWVGGGILLVVV